MDAPRVVNCDGDELPFARSFLYRLVWLIVDVGHKREWHWCHHGLMHVIPLPVMRNALAEYFDFLRQKQGREPMPRHVGKFLWGQTISVADHLKQVNESPHARPADEAPGGGEAKQ